MTSRSPGHRRIFSVKAPPGSRRKLHNSPPEKHSGLVRRFVPSPLTLKPHTDSLLRPSKVLLNVSIENSLGAIPVLMSPENSVGDLIKAALVFYQKEKRRPFLKNTDPNCYDLHFSSFTLESLKAEEKIMNLGSRNYFLRLKPCTFSCFGKENVTSDYAFPWIIFLHLLL